MHAYLLALTTLMFCCAPYGAADAAKRIALVIGNNAYSEVSKLEKATGDAQAISATLQGLGFDVITLLDANRQRMARALVEFETRVSPGDTALFFFAGHGVALDGGNYLMPTDVPNVSEGQRNLLRTEGFLADDITERLRERGAATTVMVLDACRNNPFKAGPGRSIGQSRGLSRMDTRRGMFVMFSAGAGQEALDRLGPDDVHPNSVFTRLFIDLVKRPDLDLIDVAKELQVEVPKLAASIGHEQLPAYYDQIPGPDLSRPHRCSGAATRSSATRAAGAAASRGVTASGNRSAAAGTRRRDTTSRADGPASGRSVAARDLPGAGQCVGWHSQRAQRPGHEFPAGDFNPGRSDRPCDRPVPEATRSPQHA